MITVRIDMGERPSEVTVEPWGNLFLLRQKGELLVLTEEGARELSNALLNTLDQRDAKRRENGVS